MCGFLDCGILERGFVLLFCDRCEREHALAFSCKWRAICPSCGARRMQDTAAQLVRQPVLEIDLFVAEAATRGGTHEVERDGVQLDVGVQHLACAHHECVGRDRDGVPIVRPARDQCRNDRMGRSSRCVTDRSATFARGA
ncbi:MAG: transposase zinc-binding domain-containing protein [Deltaproteobacteria bacterium]|nr:transposase zinc-binding domain-containing protein [Deltaproteobacteria bacterium]